MDRYPISDIDPNFFIPEVGGGVNTIPLQPGSLRQPASPPFLWNGQICQFFIAGVYDEQGLTLGNYNYLGHLYGAYRWGSWSYGVSGFSVSPDWVWNDNNQIWNAQPYGRWTYYSHWHFSIVPDLSQLTYHSTEWVLTLEDPPSNDYTGIAGSGTLHIINWGLNLYLNRRKSYGVVIGYYDPNAPLPETKSIIPQVAGLGLLSLLMLGATGLPSRRRKVTG